MKQRVYDGMAPDSLTNCLNEAYYDDLDYLHWSIALQLSEFIIMEKLINDIEISKISILDTEISMTFNPITKYHIYHVIYKKVG